MNPKLLLFCLYLIPFSLAAQIPSDGYFDPERDPVGRIDSAGRWSFLVQETGLVLSLKATLPEVGQVLSVSRQQLRNGPHLVFKCRSLSAPESSLFIAVAIRQEPDGRCYAEQQYQTCKGEPCSDCGFSSNGCFCAAPPGPDPAEIGTCNHSVSTGMALKKVKLAVE
jgi:hypothetical protein